MSKPHEQLHKINSISRWNEITAHNNPHSVLKEFPPQRDPFIGERYPQSDSSPAFEPLLTGDGEGSIRRQRYVGVDPALLKADAPCYMLSTVVNNNKSLSPDSNPDVYVWNSSIDQHHTYFPYGEIHRDTYQINEYPTANPHLQLNSSPASNDERSLHDDAIAIPASRTPQQEFPSSYTSSLSPVSETMSYFVSDRCKSNGFDSNAQLEDIHKERSERPRRRKNNKQDGDLKICGICGDIAKSLHFGGMACDSCKAFFRRSVQTKSCQSFKCSLEQNCQITKSNRKCCQYCRFQKCLSIGMETRWVMPESERMDLWKSKLARHREIKAISQEVTIYTPVQVPSNLTTSLSTQDTQTIKDLTLLQEVVFASSAYPSVCNNAEELSAVFFCICQKLQKFFFRNEDFQRLISDDQACIMKSGIAMSIYIHGAYLYDVDNNTWPASDNKPYLKIPVVTNSLLKAFTVFNEIYEALMSFYTEYGNDIKDESVLALLCSIALFFEPSPDVKCKSQVITNRNYYINLLKNYLIDTLGPHIGDEKFAHVMGCYVHTKKIVSYHNKVSIEPNFRPKKLTLNPASFDLQMTYLIQGLRQSRMAGLPQFSSVFGPPKAGDKRLRKVNRNEAYYALLTSVIFGYETKADKLLSYLHPEILIQKRPTGITRQIE